MTTPATYPVRHVTVARFCELTGYSERAVEAMRRDGKWIEGRIWRKVSGRILIDLEA